MANKCFSCRFARADKCEKIFSRSFRIVNKCLRYAPDSRVLSVSEVCKILRISHHSYLKVKKEYGVDLFIKKLKALSYNVVVSKTESGQIRFIQKL